MGPRSQKEDISKMFSFPKRARKTLVVGLVALAVPILGASAAQASIGTGNQVTTSRPDLRTATIVPTFNEVEYCFDGSSAGTDLAAGTLFQVGGYVTNGIQNGGPASKVSGNCFQSQFPTAGPGVTDLTSATYGHVTAGAVKNSIGSLTNSQDSAPLIGSTTKNGTRGNTVGPDLQIAAANVGSSTNQIGFQFDQKIQTTGAGSGVCNQAVPSAAPGFYYYDNQGFLHNNGIFLGCSNSSGGNGTVLIQYPGATSPVEESRRAFVVNNQVFSQGPTLRGNPTFSVVVVGGAGSTSNDPDLLSAELADPTGASNSIDFVFDEAVTAPQPGRFHAILADGHGGTNNAPVNFVPVDGNNAALLNSDQGANTRVRVQFTGLELVSEFVVGAYEDCSNTQGTPPAVQPTTQECTPGATAAVVSANDGQAAPPNGLPSGDNANAFALGWTTGPDPVSASKNPADQAFTIRFDQRLLSLGAPAQLVDTSGITGILCTPNTIGTLGAPGQQNATYQCPSGSDVNNSVGAYLPGPQANNSGTGDVFSTRIWPNADQIVAFG